MRTARLFTLSLALIVAACASAPPKRINPPAVSIQRLVMQASGAYAIELRLQNHSDVPMHFAGINLQLRVAGIDAGRLRTQPDIDVSPHNAEIVHLRLSADKSYMLRGTVDISEPKRSYDIVFESRLSPVPGKPGEFR